MGKATTGSSPILKKPVFPNRILRAKSHPHFPRGHISDGSRKIRPESARVEIFLVRGAVAAHGELRGVPADGGAEDARGFRAEESLPPACSAL